MTVSYLTFMKHAEKVTKTASASRPILKGVHHTEDGRLVVTDSHRLYVAKGVHERKDGSVVQPKTGEIIEGNYPDVSRLIPESDPKLTLEVNVTEALKAAKALKSLLQVAEKSIVTKLTVAEDGKAFLLVNSPVVEGSYFLGNAEAGSEAEPLSFNIQFLIDALEMFKDAGLVKVTLNIFGSVRPFTIRHGDDLMALLLPIRTY